MMVWKRMACERMVWKRAGMRVWERMVWKRAGMRVCERMV